MISEDRVEELLRETFRAHENLAEEASVDTIAGNPTSPFRKSDRK